MLNGVLGRAGNGTQAYNTPDKKGRITDIIYGSNPSNDRSNMNSR